MGSFSVTGEEHLRLLRALHFGVAGLQALLLIFTGILLLVSAAAARGPAMIVLWSLVGAMMAAMLLLNLLAARALPHGGRKLSIIAGCLSLPSAPIGTAFGIYVLLVHFKFVPENP